MSWLVTATGLLLLAAGCGTLLFPTAARSLLHWLRTGRHLGLAIMLRLLLGLALLLGARATRIPALSIGLGLLLLLAALSIPVLGEERALRALDWWLARPGRWLRAWGALVAGLGLLVTWLGN